MDIDKHEMEVVVIFESLLSAYLERSASTGTLKMHQQKLKLLGKSNEMVSTIRVDESGSTRVAPAGIGAPKTLQLLGEIFDGLVEVSGFSKGIEEAMDEAAEIAKLVLKRFGNRPTDLKVTDRILRGYLSGTVPLGIEGADDLFPAGIPKSSMLLAEGSPSTERDLISIGFIAGGMQRGENVIVVLSSRSPDAFRKSMSEGGFKTNTYESRKMMRIVDWFSHRERRIVGVEEDKGVLRTSKDMTNLGVAIEKAVASMGFAPSKRALIDVVDSTEGIATPESVTNFVQKVSGFLKEREYTSLWSLDPESVPTKVTAAMHQTADGIITIIEKSEGKKDVAVKSLRGTPARKEPMSMSITKKGLRFIGQQADSSEALAQFEAIPGVDKGMAQSLFDAGFHNMEQLEKATVDGMAKAQGIGETVAGGIHDYLRSVEYARKMLLRRSSVWVKQGKARSADSDPGRAIEAFKRAIEIAPENAEAWYELGAKLFDAKDVDEARKCFDKAVSIDPIYREDWYGEDGYVPEESFKCSACGGEVDTDTPRCPNCGVPFTLDERKRLQYSLKR